VAESQVPSAEFNFVAAIATFRVNDGSCPWDDVMCDRTAGGGQLDLTPWIRSQDPPE